MITKMTFFLATLSASFFAYGAENWYIQEMNVKKTSYHMASAECVENALPCTMKALELGQSYKTTHLRDICNGLAFCEDHLSEGQPRYVPLVVTCGEEYSQLKPGHSLTLSMRDQFSARKRLEVYYCL
jgi:hypothetical protein